MASQGSGQQLVGEAQVVCGRGGGVDWYRREAWARLVVVNEPLLSALGRASLSQIDRMNQQVRGVVRWAPWVVMVELYSQSHVGKLRRWRYSRIEAMARDRMLFGN